MSIQPLRVDVFRAGVHNVGSHDEYLSTLPCMSSSSSEIKGEVLFGVRGVRSDQDAGNRRHHDLTPLDITTYKEQTNQQQRYNNTFLKPVNQYDDEWSSASWEGVLIHWL